MRFFAPMIAVTLGAQPAPPAAQGASTQVMRDLVVLGGSEDDQRFAKAAMGLLPGTAVTDREVLKALESVQATDRFRSCTHRWVPAKEAQVLEVQVDPWPIVDSWRWTGDPVPASLVDSLFPRLRKGLRVGTHRLESWRADAERRVRESGYPAATVHANRLDRDTGLSLELHLGKPDLVQEIRVETGSGPYSPEKILSLTGLKEGLSLFTASEKLRVLRKLQRTLLADRRYEGSVALDWEPGRGQVLIRIVAGPLVRLEYQGGGLGLTRLKDLVPLTWADRYHPGLLDEGTQRIAMKLKSKGYFEAKVRCERTVLRGTASAPAEVRVLYVAEHGPKVRISALRFERNRELSTAELVSAARFSSAWYWLKKPLATPDFINLIEDRVKAAYITRGFPEVAVRRRLEPAGAHHVLVLQIKEGTRKFLNSATLTLPPGAAWSKEAFAACLLPFLMEAATSVRGDSGSFSSDRPGLAGIQGAFRFLAPQKDQEGSRIRLEFSRPIPYVRNDLRTVLTRLKVEAQGIGVLRPREKIFTEGGEDGLDLFIEIPPVSVAELHHLIVEGSDRTRAEAVLRSIPMSPGTPLDPGKVRQAQAELGELGAFRRIEFVNGTGDGTPPTPGETNPAEEGRLLLKLEERSPWEFTSAFGYDKLFGYHISFGAQRHNLQGMGRTMDFGFRAGDATLNSPFLRKAFPTGEFTRSVDIFSLGYSDPWLPTHWLPWVPATGRYRFEASYIQEQKTSYLIRRRRVTNLLEWPMGERQVLQLGHRFERSEARLVDIAPGFEAIFQAHDFLNEATRGPAHAVVSAPFIGFIRDTRNNRLDPTEGGNTVAKLELSTQLFGTSANASFLKLDMRHQHFWPIGSRAQYGVVGLGVRLGAAWPTADSAEEFPIAERFFAGGPGSHRGVEPDFLGPLGGIPLLQRNSRGKFEPTFQEGTGFLLYEIIPTGGQGLALMNLDYRFPLVENIFWGEIFVDSGQVYARLRHPNANSANGTTTPFDQPAFPALRTALGIGLIFKFGLPLKIEYGVDWNRFFGKPRSRAQSQTQLKNLLISAGYTF